MKKLGLLFAVAALFTSCLFDTDDSGVSSWLSSHGMPDSYKVQVLTIDNLKPDSVILGQNLVPRKADSLAFLLGRTSNVSQDMVMEFYFNLTDKKLAKLKSDSLSAALSFCWFQNLYKTAGFPSDSVPGKEVVDVNLSWKIRYAKTKNQLIKMASVADSVWLDSLQYWEADGSADTTFEVSYTKKDTSVVGLDLPSALVEELKKATYGVYLQLRLSTPKLEKLYRFYGPGTKRQPYMYLFAGDSSFHTFNTARAANIMEINEDCEDCPVIHGGGRDSLVLVFPSEKILDAVQEAYKDSPLENKGDGYDVRQTVSLAQLTMASNDGESESEFGLPIQVVVGSFIDSLGTEIRRMEQYRLNKNVIVEDGHPNLVFHESDSLSLQISQGVRELVNKASDKNPLRIVLKMGYPMLQERDTLYYDRIDDDGNTIRIFLGNFDYARYDFTKAVENPMSLKLWMSSKRIDK
ncbi:MAG: hypothetical protein MJZ25_10315 [Fibrobacter sp.]|nr:hypothetical protein [Fibrobacter sp.]